MPRMWLEITHLDLNPEKKSQLNEKRRERKLTSASADTTQMLKWSNKEFAQPS